MSQFEIAHRFTAASEGGYSNHPEDRGGETYAGIARNFWPDWAGWELIDQGDRGSAELKQEVLNFYRSKFWDRYQLGQYPTRTAVCLYDLLVNSGPKWMANITQESLVSCGVDVVVDGAWGPNTANALFEYTLRPSPAESVFVEQYLNERKMFYQRIVQNNPSQQVFFNGWMNRINNLRDYLNEI